MPAIGPEFGFGLYVHWPYCARICPYCDFNVYAAKDRDSEPLLDAIIADIRAQSARLSGHPALDSVFLGGGTPSLLSSAQIGRLLDTVNDTFDIAQYAEITLETNPNDVLREDPSDWAKAGINRLSLGLQSLDDDALSFLGRDHDANAARGALDQVQKRFDNHSVDLIYARPGQSLAAWDTELSEVLALGAPHLSLYELTIEERTAFGKRAARGEMTPMPDDEQADLYELTNAISEAHGLHAYEVSNHARSPDFESRHNHIYWASGDWIGVGPGAHGRLTIDGQRIATESPRRPAEYIASPRPVEADLSGRDAAREFLTMALRPVLGLQLRRFEALFGDAADIDLVSNLSANGLAIVEDEYLRLTTKGRLMADYIAAQLAPD